MSLDARVISQKAPVPITPVVVRGTATAGHPPTAWVQGSLSASEHRSGHELTVDGKMPTPSQVLGVPKPGDLGREFPLAAMAGDRITALLQRIRLQTWVAGRSLASGHWAAELPGGTGGFHAVLKGRMILRDDQGEVHQLAAGDAVVITRGDCVLIGDHPDSPRVPLDRIVNKELVKRHGGLEIGAGPAEVEFIGGLILFDGATTSQLKSALPSAIVLRGSAQGPDGLVPTIVRLVEAQTRDTSAGTHAVMTTLVHTLFLEAARVALTDRTRDRTGIAGALMDEHLGPALSLIHATPSRDWSLAQMANEAGLSRTIFHERFMLMMGVPPATYLREYRLQIAADQLAQTELAVGEIATRVGYASQGAFCSAFKRWAGVTPGEYRVAPRRLERPSERGS